MKLREKHNENSVNDHEKKNEDREGYHKTKKVPDEKLQQAVEVDERKKRYEGIESNIPEQVKGTEQLSASGYAEAEKMPAVSSFFFFV